MERFKRTVAESLSQVLELPVRELSGLIERPRRPELGDLSFPCFHLAKRLKRSPKEIAEDIASRLALPKDVFAPPAAAGGYVNLRILPAALARETVPEAIRDSDRCAHSNMGEGKTVLIEYSSPNIAKPFGIGHLRSTGIGGALARIFSGLGYRVVRLNHLGDWGTQFGLLLEIFLEKGNEKELAERGVKYLAELYVEANDRAKENEDIARAGRERFKMMEAGDEESLELWERFRTLSIKEFSRIWDTFGERFDSLDGEAAYRDKIDAAIDSVGRVDDGSGKGLAEISDGALIVQLGDDVPPAMLRKSDGATTYLARDVAAALHRREKYDFERSLYVVGADQDLHFRQLFRLLKSMEFDWAEKVEHVKFGMVRFGGGKLRTRTGAGILLEDVLEEAIRRAAEVVRENNRELSEKEVEALSKPIGIGAVKFADLSRRRIKDADFELERIVALTGDTGPYVQYSHARFCSILRKWGGEVESLVDAPVSLLDGEEETACVRAISLLGEKVRSAGDMAEPSILASHLLELSSTANRFYNNCPVLGETGGKRTARLALVAALRNALASGLRLLGIEPPERM